MRIRVPGRIIALGFLLALLCLTPSFAPVVHAKPILPDNWGDNPVPGPNDPTPKGDNDGGVLAAGLYRPTTLATQGGTGTLTVVGSRHSWSAYRTVYAVAGLRGFLALLQLQGWTYQLR
jgi:hypothetical protein